MNLMVKLAWACLLLANICNAYSELDFPEYENTKDADLGEDDFGVLNKINEIKVPSLPKVEV
jgi:hypothetical protein